MSNYKILDTRGKEIKTDVKLHPGEILEKELVSRNIQKSTFCTLIGLRPSHFSELIHGKRHIRATLSIKPQEHLDINAEFWLRIQMQYDLFIERHKSAK